MKNAIETMTISTFLSNVWTGNSTFRANSHIPVIAINEEQYLISGPGDLDAVKYSCQVNKKDIFNVNNFFQLWAGNVKESNKNLYECMICYKGYKKEMLVGLACCKTIHEVKITCHDCQSKASLQKKCFFCNNQEPTWIDNDKIQDKFFNPFVFDNEDDLAEQQPLSSFSTFLNQKLTEKNNDALNISNIPFYIFNGETKKISKIKKK